MKPAESNLDSPLLVADTLLKSIEVQQEIANRDLRSTGETIKKTNEAISKSREAIVRADALIQSGRSSR